jgi:phosphatidylinositol alpha-1,6-mannosyltransferase
VKHLLVTNDFPPKIGGIQSLLWEWWRRLPADQFAVLTSRYPGADRFDAEQPFRVTRTRERTLLPHPAMTRRIERMAEEFGAQLVVLDPAVPLGLVGPNLDRPYAVVLHGAEVTVPGRLPGSRQLLANVLRRARHIVSAGQFAANEAVAAAGQALPITVVTPGVDIERFVPLDDAVRHAARARFGLPGAGPIVVSIARLVPRKGFDVLIRAVGVLARRYPDLRLVVAGRGRDERRLRRLAAEHRAPVTFFGRIDHDELPVLFGCGDVFAMPCRDRWGGLEQEGFGIVFIEAAACGVAQLAGQSGGAAEAVIDGVTGIVVGSPEDWRAVAAGLEALLDDEPLRRKMAAAARQRACAEFSYGVLTARLGTALGVDR